MDTKKISTVWHDFAAPFDRTSPQYACHIHGFDGRLTRVVWAYYIGVVGPALIAAGVAFGAHIHVPMVAWGLLAGVGFPLGGWAAWLTFTDVGYCFPTCTCAYNLKEDQ